MKGLRALIWCSLVMYSCESATSDIGSDFFSDGALDFSFIDTATVKLSTVQIEDLASNGATRILVGTHRDDILGKITAIPFFQISPSGDVNFKGENITYDHTSLLLPLDHYYYYDTLSLLTLHVHRVIAEIKLDDGHLYNANTFSIDKDPIGSITLRPKPNADSIEIPLSDLLGQEIFQKAITNDEQLTSTSFPKYIRGIAVVPDTSVSSSILGLTTNPQLRVYYLDKRVTPVEKKHIEFNVTSASGMYFTNVTCDRKNTDLEMIPSGKERLRSSLTNDKSFIQAGAGLALRVDIPYLRNLKELSNFYVIRADLEIRIVRKSEKGSARLPQYLKVFKADKRNAIYQKLDISASLVEDSELGRDTYYALDVTQFVKEQMELQMLNENALLFTTDETTFPVSADRIYAAAPGYEYKTRLRIFFATVNN